MKESLIKKFDQWLFHHVELIKSHPQIAPLLSKIEQLPDAQQKIIHQSSALIIGLCPLVIFFGVYLHNVSLRSQLETNEELLEVINNITSKSNELSQLTRSLAGPTAYEEQSSFEQKLRGTLANKGIDSGNFSIQNFESGSSTEEILSFEATLSFKRISTAQLISVIEALIIQDKVKVKNIDVLKNEENSTLAGTIQIQHIGRRGI